MRWRDKLRLRGWSLVRRRRVERELDDELRFHLEQQIAENLAAGMSAEEARYAARRSVGGVEQIKEECRDTRGVNLIEDLLQDFRYSVRALRRNSGFTTAAIVMLALGIGAVTAVFSVVDATLIRPLPFADAGRIVELARMSPRFDHPVPISGADFLDWRARSRTFAAMAAYDFSSFTRMTAAGPERVSVGRVSPTFFSVLGVRPALGRAFLPDEDQPTNAHVALLSFGAWQQWFGADAQSLGQNLLLNGESYTIAAVLPREFKFPGARDVQVWTPLALKAGVDRSNHWLYAIGKLPADVSLRQAQAGLDVVARQLQTEYPHEDADQGIVAVPFQGWTSAGAKDLVLIFFGAVTLVLLVVCTNVASLTLARAVSRSKSFAMRAALGAGRFRLIRELLTESVILALAGGALGIVLANVLTTFFRTQEFIYLPFPDAITVDGRALAFALALSVLTGMVFGLAPAVQVSRADLNEVLKGGGVDLGRERRWPLRSVLVVAETALSLVLLTGAALLVRSMIQILHTAPGYQTEHVLTFWLSPPAGRYPNDHALARLSESALDRIASIPGVRSVGLTTALPPSGWEDDGGFIVVKHPPQDIQHAPDTIVDAVSPGYLATMQIPLIRGRLLTERDNRPDAPKVVVISRSLADNYFAGEDPIGQQMRFEEDNQKNLWTVVGIVGDTRFFGWDHDEGVFTYFPYQALGGRSHFAISVRTAVDPASVTAQVKQAIWSADKELPLLDTATMRQRLDDAFAPRRFDSALLGAFAGVAVVLAAIGIFGLLSYVVSQRRREIGIRMALGASRQDVQRLMLKRAVMLTGVGIACGVPCSFLGALLLRGFLYDTKPFDVGAFAIAVGVMLAAGVIAAYIPARRAASLDPMRALRTE
jgi:macrolide transport system ATP-binding/permease protein